MPRMLLPMMALGLAFACGSESKPTKDWVTDVTQHETLQAKDTALADLSDASSPIPFDWCFPSLPPDKACHASKRQPDSANVKMALEIARAQIARHPPETLEWNWEEAVLQIGMVALYDVTGEQELQDYFRAWMDHHIEKGYVIGTSDTCAPASVAVALFRQTGEERYRVVVEGALVYLYDIALRTDEGGISHLGTVPLKTLWVDSLFMFGNVLYGWGEATGDEKALNEFGTQFELFSDLMQDDTGFYVHAYDWIMEQTPGVYWGRGNGWVAVAGAMYHSILFDRGKNRPAVTEALVRLLVAAREAQDPETGLWWTILTRPGEIYLETSATALFAFGMARAWRYGLVGDDVLLSIDHAMLGVKSRIAVGSDGMLLVTGISGPTSADKYEEYARVPLEDDLPFGVGAVLLSLTETSGLPAVTEENKEGE